MILQTTFASVIKKLGRAWNNITIPTRLKINLRAAVENKSVKLFYRFMHSIYQ